MKRKQVFDYQKYRSYITSADWLIRKSRFILTYIRRGWTIECGKCESKHDLQIHHITYENLYKEKNEDLMILCRKCHEHRHKDKKAFEKEMWDDVIKIIDELYGTEKNV